MILLLPLLIGCIPDDWNGEPYMGPPSGTPTSSDTGLPTGTAVDGIVGSWVSEGADISELLAGDPFLYVRVDATFNADGTYEVIGEDADGTSWPLVGVFFASAGSPGTISLNQTEPYEATADGIWQVDGNTLTYEVVQLAPDYGFTAPTAGSGFGTSTGPGLAPGANVQTYRWAP